EQPTRDDHSQLGERPVPVTERKLGDESLYHAPFIIAKQPAIRFGQERAELSFVPLSQHRADLTVFGQPPFQVLQRRTSSSFIAVILLEDPAGSEPGPRADRVEPKIDFHQIYSPEIPLSAWWALGGGGGQCDREP